MWRKITKYWLWLLFLFFIGIRLVGLFWDEGYGLHPDERLYVRSGLAMSLPQSITEFFSPDSPLNPNMFYYGSFPLYLYKINAFFVSMITSIDQYYTLYGVSRIISVLLNVSGIYFVYQIGRDFFTKKIGFVGALFVGLSPVAIQVSHFNTTESFLLFFGPAILYCALAYLDQKRLRTLVMISILIGMAAATKVVGVSFSIFIPLLFKDEILYLIQNRSLRNSQAWILRVLLAGLLIVFVFLLFSPYTVIDFSHFAAQQGYMQSVITGVTKAPSVQIYEGTLPYWYHITHNFPWLISFLAVPFIIFGWGYALFKAVQFRDYKYVVLCVWPTLYFLVAGQWYAKFVRYLVPLLPFISLMVAIVLHKITANLSPFVRKVLYGSLISFQVITALGFVVIYLYPHTRIAASTWISAEIPSDAVILQELWDDPLPLSIQLDDPKLRQINSFEDESLQKFDTLLESLQTSDYIVLSSRRVWQAILQNPEKYPVSSRYFEALFDEKLGFRKIAEFTNYPYLLWWEINDDWFDESWQSYDHPPVYIFQKEAKLTNEELSAILLLN